MKTFITPTTDLRRTYEISKMTRKAIGISVAESAIDASRKALFKETVYFTV
jgi:hypothetical protein